ncbi:MAG: hypothetical protein U0X20_09895 [Caldilineaceae bacterium]
MLAVPAGCGGAGPDLWTGMRVGRTQVRRGQMHYTDLQGDALNQAGVGEGTEVWVAQGVYTPGITYTATFSIPAGVAIYGGFAATETERTLARLEWRT